MKALVAVKRVVDYNVKVASSGQTGVETATSDVDEPVRRDPPSRKGCGCAKPASSRR